MKRIRLSAVLFCLLTSSAAAAADENAEPSCCHAVAQGLPVAALAVAVGTAGDRPLHVVPDDPTLLSFDEPGVCLENLVNTLLKSGKLRALDCGENFGLFGTELSAKAMSCDAVEKPISELPPGSLDGWSVRGVFAQEHGQRLAVLSTEDLRSYLLGAGTSLASGGAKVDGIAERGVLVRKGGVDMLEEGAMPVAVYPMGDVKPFTCTAIEEAPPAAEEEPASEEAASEEAATAETVTETTTAEPAAEDAPAEDAPAEDATAAKGEADAETPAAEEPPEPIVVSYQCEGFAPDFIQRPLPTDLCDDPTHAGQTVTVTLDFGPEGWTRKVLDVDIDEEVRETLLQAISDWRILPVEVQPGELGQVRVTLEAVLEIPCR